jgi:hypothetical protein
VVRLSMWSVARDNGNSAGAHFASPDSSGIAQQPFDFSAIFHQFDPGSAQSALTAGGAAASSAGVASGGTGSDPRVAQMIQSMAAMPASAAASDAIGQAASNPSSELFALTTPHA